MNLPNPQAARPSFLLILGLALAAGADAPPGRRADQDALKPVAAFVGDWKGVGQVERGKTRGAWTESAHWAWKLTPDSAALELTVERGKHLKSGTLRPGKAPHSVVFEAVLADGSPRTFEGTLTGPSQPLILTAAPGAPAEGPRRLRFTPLHETRLLTLFEAEGPQPRAFHKLGEVGYTRAGVAFAAGDASPVCIVTEGRGTTKVTHKGQTYWVCCSGCRDLFNENPEAVLAEAEARRKANAAK